MLKAVREATGQRFPEDGSLPSKRLRLSRRLGVGMIRSAVNVSRASYVDGICLCVPSFTESVDDSGQRWEGLLDHMNELYGRGSFDEGSETIRFAALIAGQSRLGRHLAECFTHMKHETLGDMIHAEIPEDSPFKLGPDGAGLVDGKFVLRPHQDSRRIESK